MSDRLHYDLMLAALARQSLVTIDDSHIYVHGLVQKAVRSAFSLPESRSWTLYAARSLMELLKELDGHEDEWYKLGIAELLLPHALSIADQAEEKLPMEWSRMHNFPSWIAIRDTARSLETIAYYLRGAVNKTRGQAAAARSLELAIEAFPFLLGFLDADEATVFWTLQSASEVVAFYAVTTGDTAQAEAALRRAFALFLSERPHRTISLTRGHSISPILTECRFIVLFSLITVLRASGKMSEATLLEERARDDLARYRYLDRMGRIRQTMASMLGAPDGELGR